MKTYLLLPFLLGLPGIGHATVTANYADALRACASTDGIAFVEFFTTSPPDTTPTPSPL
jgi:hypothetical protein